MDSRSHHATVTVSRQHKEDIGQREIFVSLDGTELAILRHGETVSRSVEPGSHELRVHNTLFRKKLPLVLSAGEHARFMVVNRPGWGTYTLVTFLGAGPVYLSVEREDETDSLRPSAGH